MKRSLSAGSVGLSVRRRAPALLGLALFTAHASGQLRLTADFGKDRFASGEELCLRLVFENTGKTPLPIVRPATVDSDVLRVRLLNSAGQNVLEGAGGQAPAGMDDVSRLAPGQKTEVAFDLHGQLLMGLPPGDYGFSVEYACPAAKFPIKSREVVDLKASSQEGKLIITARTPEQDAQAKQFESAFRAPDVATQIARCRDALAAHPDGMFSRRLRMLMALALTKTGNLDEAIVQYSRVLAEHGASSATQATCRAKLGLAYRERGDLETAIEMMRQVDTRQARQLVVVWTRELESRRP